MRSFMASLLLLSVLLPAVATASPFLAAPGDNFAGQININPGASFHEEPANHQTIYLNNVGQISVTLGATTVSEQIYLIGADYTPSSGFWILETVFPIIVIELEGNSSHAITPHLLSEYTSTFFTLVYDLTQYSGTLSSLDATAVAGQFNFSGTIEAVYPPVPEPSTWAMLLLGFAGIGFLTWRRRLYA